MSSLHFIRPYWLLALIPWVVAAFVLLRHQTRQTSWSDVCDPHLLKHQLIDDEKGTFLSVIPLMLTLLLMTLGLAGPSWTKLPVPTYQTVIPRVILLDMSSEMFNTDVKPTRLFRAKLFIRDILSQAKEGQIGLIAYSAMPFVVSPLTQDNHTIETLLASLKPEIMPVDGHDLVDGLREAKTLLDQAGFPIGDILVITANQPSENAIAEAQNLASEHVTTSVMPINGSQTISPQALSLAKAGNGLIIDSRRANTDLSQWLNNEKRSHQLQADVMNHVPLWRDEGHWFILFGLLCLLPMFRRGALEAIS